MVLFFCTWLTATVVYIWWQLFLFTVVVVNIFLLKQTNSAERYPFNSQKRGRLVSDHYVAAVCRECEHLQSWQCLTTFRQNSTLHGCILQCLCFCWLAFAFFFSEAMVYCDSLLVFNSQQLCFRLQFSSRVLSFCHCISEGKWRSLLCCTAK